MPTKARRQRDRERDRTIHAHKVGGGRTGWEANLDAVALLLAAFGYTTTPPAPIASPRPHFLPF